MTVTLLITTYNWPEALELVLRSVASQSVLPNEIAIADDGSTKDTDQLILKLKKEFSIPVKHIWHEDVGFTKTVILNKALQEIQSDYIIQIDGDVILHKHFIKDHIRQSEPNTYLFGSRISLKEEYSKKVLQNKKIKFHWTNTGLLRRSRAIYLPLFSKFLTKKSNQSSGKLRGCNMSYWRKDAVAINGYNEDLIGWGYEDFNFAQRLLNSGISSKRIKHIALQFHIYHKEAPRGNTELGDKINIETAKNKITKCKNGLVKL
ncbi:glycosyltransferase family 2 protein [Aquimarina mytili]|uniref:Glycosyltransferase family 2 protein n=1 Tax=Aquimarina mytili TaxID=874423 RepID=A0A936ZUT5_9FLAO|nr:glycosyltransferase family 2 protein [Aquimarina mytili]MBL0682551.1 glycosyltransferase family 2 protein [Aquimarina mytili]